MHPSSNFRSYSNEPDRYHASICFFFFSVTPVSVSEPDPWIVFHWMTDGPSQLSNPRLEFWEFLGRLLQFKPHHLDETPVASCVASCTLLLLLFVVRNWFTTLVRCSQPTIHVLAYTEVTTTQCLAKSHRRSMTTVALPLRRSARSFWATKMGPTTMTPSRGNGPGKMVSSNK